MQKLSEGPRRLCMVIGLLFVAAWVLFAAFSSNGYASGQVIYRAPQGQDMVCT
ncbi:hypothetical protein PS880_05045 [Pseudomonas fluorescens]|uniref:Uncharacterized protein n=1 Tax=Pseudomonas fluorescens TaxID=294 RepID=A0A5E7P6K8_PSEFL|nr:hypothetical protein PS880_05045 [Pseudomonas fluorescens]